MRGMRFFFISLCVCALASCSVFFGGDDSKEEGDDNGMERYPDTILRGFIRSSVDQNGHLLWQIKAREGRIFNESNHIYLTDFILYSFDEAGQISYTLRARRGFMDNNAGTITAKLDVVLRSGNGRVLETEEAYANNDEKIISNTVLNRITQEDGTVMIGTNLWAQSDLGVFRLSGAQGEAREGADDNLLGGPKKGNSSSASVSSSPGAPIRETTPSVSRGVSSAGASQTGSHAGKADHLIPDYDENSLERLRDALAFPEAMYFPETNPWGEASLFGESSADSENHEQKSGAKD
jgi:LPS export ABC transporter protein LptC